ncbi:MAG: hypothetical protein EAZ07_02050 [Cytophagales bacterium]|nr:MAG: hypothetical protein EAZ07_02050 [Cytophagales bacterium]
MHSPYYFLKTFFLLIVLVIVSSCANYYQTNIRFNNAYTSGDFEEAEKILNKKKKAALKKDRLIYFMKQGSVAHMQGYYTKSNEYFEEAYKVADSYHTNLVNEGVALLLNDNIIEYKGEDYELLYINYYKAFNFLRLGKKAEALVECRRMNNRLTYINGKYGNENTLKRNAFIHLMMGLIYETNLEYNNAFIAYRNSLEVYENEYTTLLGTNTPYQLKIDVIRTAFLTGLYDQVTYYENKFNIKYKDIPKNTTEMIFFWNNGMCPIKEEWSINFSIIPGGDGIVTFVNSDLGLSFPFPMSREEYKNNNFSDLQFIRAAFPKFSERPLLFSNAKIETNNSTYSLEKTEDINAIAFKTLNDKMLREMGKSLLRLAIKKGAELALRKQNQNAGMLLGVFNAITEKTDTRQWPVLPHSIYYSRVPIKEGLQKVNFSYSSRDGRSTKRFVIEVVGYKNEMNFQSFNTL